MSTSSESDIVEPLLVGSPGRWACALAEGLTNSDSEERRKVRLTQRKLWAAIALAVTFMIVEIAGGLYAGSLAILTDAAHLLSDVGGFGVALFATYAACRKTTSSSFSFGSHRLEVLGALASVLSVWWITGVLVWEAIHRLLNPHPVDGRAMFYLAVIGICVNLGLMAILGGHHHHHGHSHDHDHDHNHDHFHDHSQIEEHGPAIQANRLIENFSDHLSDLEDSAAVGAIANRKTHPTTRFQEEEEDEEEEFTLLRDAEEGLDRQSYATVYQDALSNNSDAESHVGGNNNSPQHDNHHGHDGIQAVNESESEAHAHHHHKHENMNLRGAFIHVLGDLVQSVGVAIAGALIWMHQGDARWAMADPICTFLFAVLVLASTFTILKDVADVLMERAPHGFRDLEAVRRNLLRASGALDVHDLHIWSLTPGIPLMCGHLVVGQGDDADEVLQKAATYCRSLGIKHTTFQLVKDGARCTCSDGGNSVNTSTRSSRVSLA
jgi:solute carrier family 30 (zinc transporter), member 2